MDYGQALGKTLYQIIELTSTAKTPTHQVHQPGTIRVQGPVLYQALDVNSAFGKVVHILNLTKKSENQYTNGLPSYKVCSEHKAGEKLHTMYDL